MAKDIQFINVQQVRKYTSADEAENGFRFFRYSQDFRSELDFGQTAGNVDIRITGNQLQTFAKCLVDFFGYSLPQVSFEASLKNSESIENSKYKGKSKISQTIGEIQSGRGNLAGISQYLKLELIKRYNPSYAKNKTDAQLLQENIQLSEAAEEQIGVIGPVTYNFIVRQAIYNWFDATYLNDPNSYLYRVLNKLKTSWSNQVIDEGLKYYIFVSNSGQPNNKPYPTVGVIFDDGDNLTNDQLVAKARNYIDFIFLRDTSSLVGEGIYQVKIDTPDKKEAPRRVCVYADLAEVLYAKKRSINYAVIDMIKAGISSLHTFKAEFKKTPQDASTLQSIIKTIPYADKWNEIEETIDNSAFYFRKQPLPDMQDMLKKDAQFFDISDAANTKVYEEQYNLILNNLVATHILYTEEIANRIKSERQVRKNVSLRSYPAEPLDEPITFYYDKNYNLLASSFKKRPTQPTEPSQIEDESICITVINNDNLTISEIKSEESILEKLSDNLNKYKKLNQETVLFITEFFISEYAKASSIYTNNVDLYPQISTDIKNDINAGNNSPEIKALANSIPPKNEFFLANDYSKISVDYLYSYDKKTLLDKDSYDIPQIQLAKLKSSNFWTTILNELPQAQASLDGFIEKHYPFLEHKNEEKKKPDEETPVNPKPEPPKAQEPPPSPNVPFERLKTEKISIPNSVDLAVNLKIDDLYSADCFAAILNLINKSVPTPLLAASDELYELLDVVYNIINGMDWCYLVNLVVEKTIETLNYIEQIYNSLTSDDDKQKAASISKSLEEVRSCLPPKRPDNARDTLENPLDAFRVPCEILSLNIPRIPYFFTADFLEILKRLIFQFVMRLAMEALFQFLNLFIKKLSELCKFEDKTANALPAVSKPNKKPRLTSPNEAMDSLLEKCGIVELLSVNPNINKNQIYSVTKQFFNYNDISNTEMDTYFYGLSSILETQEIINLFTSNIDETLYRTIVGYTNKTQFAKFQKIVFSISTTTNFFNFLGRYVNLLPCYQKLAEDRRSPNFCYDDVNDLPFSDLGSEQLFQKANDLLGQVTDMCAALSSKPNIALNDPSILDEKTKEAISAGINSIISTAYGSYLEIKKAAFNSFETIKVFNESLENSDLTQLKKVLSFSSVTTGDALVGKVATISNGNIVLTETANAYVNSKILTQFEPSKITVDFAESTKAAQLGIVGSKEEINYNVASSFTAGAEKLIIVMPNSSISEANITAVKSGTSLSLQTFEIEQFVDIFFNDSRFLKNTPNKQQVKNYYYVYDNLLSGIKDISNTNSLLRYNDVKEKLESFLGAS